jgi:2,3-bisphosphoglycerate-dependent phosphoglycerate mutase
MSIEEPTRLLVLRHGQTAWNAEQRIQGHLDMPLNDTGRWQARRLALALQGEPLAAIYSSDLQRAADTAAPLAQACGLPVQRDTGLRERDFGSFEGLSFTEIEQRWPDDARRWRERDPDFAPGGGETLRDFYARCVAQAARLAGRHGGQTIALVAHGGVLDCLYRAALGVALHAPRSWPVANATVNRLLWTPQGLSMLLWHDARHLEGETGGQPAPADTP